MLGWLGRAVGFGMLGVLAFHVGYMLGAPVAYTLTDWEPEDSQLGTDVAEAMVLVGTALWAAGFVALMLVLLTLAPRVVLVRYN